MNKITSVIFSLFAAFLFVSNANGQDVNLALNRPATSLVNFSGSNPASAFDGNINTLWASDVTEKMPWIQVDLGSPQTIGRVEVVARQDGDQPGTRYLFDIRGSNTADFSTSTFLASPGGLAFPAYGTWVGNVNVGQQFRYIRLLRTNDAGHMNMAEIRVFSNQGAIEPENVLAYPEANANLTLGEKMLVMKSTGKAMDVLNSSMNNNAGIVQNSYNFGASQRWTIKDIGGGKYSILNSKSNLCIDVPGGNYSNGIQVIQYGSSGQFNQQWSFVARSAGFYSIEANGKCLQVNNNVVEIGTYNGNDNQLWRITDAYVQNPKHSNTDWISEAKYGIMEHWLLGSGNKDLNKQFDVNYLANQLVEAGAKYFIITLGQNSGYYNSPNATYDVYAGYNPGDRMSTRDLPADLFDALNAKGIKLMLYLPSQVANQDPKAQTGFGLATGATDQPVNMDFAMKWAQVIQEWSDRYGDKISGWWFDGGYSGINFNNDIFDVYSNAVKHGNHEAIVTYNPGIFLSPHARSEDYTAGETNEPFKLVPENRFIAGRQWHMMTFLGNNWVERLPRNTAQEWMTWLTKVFEKGGSVDIDAGPNFNPGVAPVGSISDEMMAYFRQFKTAFQPNVETATQSSVDFGGIASRAFDGNSNGDYSKGSVTHTKVENNPWWTLDRQSSKLIEQLKIYNRTDCCSDRLHDFYVFVSDAPFTSTDPTATVNTPGVWSYYYPGIAGNNIVLDVNKNGRYIRVQIPGKNLALSLAEVEITSGQVPTKRTYSFDWNFVASPEGWALTHSLTGTIVNDIYNLNITANDPYMHSPDNLNIDASQLNYLTIRLKNNTAATEAELFWISDDVTNYEGVEKHVSFPLSPNSDYTEYAIDLSGNPHWTGMIRQVRLDPTTGSSGTIDLDKIVFKNKGIVTGINSMSDENGIQYYPNPVSNILNIKFQNPGDIKAIHLFNMNGEEVLTKTEITSDFKINMEDNRITSGIYTLNIVTSMGSKHSKIMVVK